ncbi:DUF6015 family protein [Picrophilus oshimae]|uniref:Uncharacterized protein n=1 Tax=Picrophilus torridus (strain ATCC 700027 / DSM 9790 / JCM 10055 / NBRC 100828 / KAW 2/3) TaxID=1122961 RepID=Q6L1L3_PICTO|nr:DUF6015 family protein [Picrophilus oshimae]AAT43139.1 hypothetical protein PTO0554 [Picrophilus oshimae DSM 9789]SMD30553.1 hypothetical protein SAMN02745355_0441 [Picrophilus oshimae DSM 9789]
MENVFQVNGNMKNQRNYVRMDELSAAISKGLSLQQRKMSKEEAESSAEHIINFFGYGTRVIDNMLEPEDRDAFYTMEDIGILETEREETTLFDGREWRIHYWILNVNRVIELANMDISETIDDDSSKYDIYNDIPEEYWKLEN